ncbi:MAG: hypothetical protein ACLR78_07405 [Roseburia sp.]
MSCWKKKSGKGYRSGCGAEVGNIRAGEQEVKVKMDKSDVCLMTGSVLITARADYVGDVWHDDHANGTDSCCRRLLCGNSAVRGTRRELSKPEKKKALNRPSTSANEKILRL